MRVKMNRERLARLIARHGSRDKAMEALKTHLKARKHHGH